MRFNRGITIAILALAVSLTGCSLLTEFDKSLLDADGGDTTGLYSIRENLVIPVEINLVSSLGLIDLSLLTPLPEADDAVLAGLLSDGTIKLTVENTATSVSYNLFGNGELVESTPSVDGQYRVEINSTRDTLTVEFFNSFEGRSLRSDGEYEAVLDVLNNDYFQVDNISVEVDVL